MYIVGSSQAATLFTLHNTLGAEKAVITRFLVSGSLIYEGNSSLSSLLKNLIGTVNQYLLKSIYQ